MAIGMYHLIVFINNLELHPRTTLPGGPQTTLYTKDLEISTVIQ